jgi:nicotinamidase-related amidase
MVENRLLDADDSVLVVVDVQERFLGKLPHAESALLIERIRWLVGVARWAQIPRIFTAEDTATNGPVHPSLADVLDADTPCFDKRHFALSGQVDIMRAVRSTGRQTAVLVGLETDVCVSQSAIGLVEQGYRAAVVADAVGSPGPDHAYGLQRMRAAGIVVVGLKGLFYEWMRTVARSEQFHAECDDVIPTPSGVRL